MCERLDFGCNMYLNNSYCVHISNLGIAGCDDPDVKSTCNFQLHVGLFSKSDNQYNFTFVKETFDSTSLDDGPHFSVLDFAAYLCRLDIFKVGE